MSAAVVFSWPMRVYLEDTDAGGVVYYANYLGFLECCRTEWLRTRGYSQKSLAREKEILFMVLNVNIDYRSPARLDDSLVVTCDPQPDGRTAIIFKQKIFRNNLESEESLKLLVEAQVRVVCVDAKSLRPRRISEYIL